MGQPNSPYARTGIPGAPSFEDGAAPDARPWVSGSNLPGEIPGWQPAQASAPQPSPYDASPYTASPYDPSSYDPSPYAAPASPAPRRSASQPRSSQRPARQPRHATPVPGVIEGFADPVPGAPVAATPTPQRGSLRIVSDDPNEIRRYAEAQRLSKTGAFVAIPRPVPNPSDGAAPQSVPAAAAQPIPPAPQVVQSAPAHMPSVAVPDPSAPLAELEQASKPSARKDLSSKIGSLKDAVVAAAGEERTWRLAIMWVTSIACVLATITMLYFPAQELYLAMRENERLTDELARNTERNDQMLERVSALQTAEGIQDEARRVYGLTLPYDNPVTVVGLDVEEPTTTTPAEIPRGSGRNSHSWATDLLDNVFGAVGSSATVAEVEDRATIVEE